MTKKAYEVDFPSREDLDDVEIVSANFGGDASVAFDDLGSADSAGSVTIQSGSHQYRIDVAYATGKVTVTAIDP